jgi:hypothetical protein
MKPGHVVRWPLVSIELPPWTAAASLVPSAEDAMADQYMIGALVRVQVAPQLVEVNMPAVPPWSFATAASLAPSAEEAIDCQEFEGALLNVQVIPPSAERKIGAPTARITPDAAATILVPSAEQATARHDTLLEATV